MPVTQLLQWLKKDWEGVSGAGQKKFLASIFYRDLFRCKFLEYRADLYTKLETKRLKGNEREKKVLGGDSDSADEHRKQVTQHGYVTVVLGNYLT